MKKKHLIKIIQLSLLVNIGVVNASDFKVEVNSLHYATSINEVSYVSDLLDEEPNLATQLNKDGLTPIHIAIKKDGLSSLKIFLEKKINPNIKNSDGDSPLIYAIKNNKYKATKILLENNASKKTKDLNGKTALDYARIKGGKMLELFTGKKKINKSEETNEKDLDILKDYLKKEIAVLSKKQSALLIPLIKELKIIKIEASEIKENNILIDENIIDIESKIITEKENRGYIEKNIINIENELRAISEKTIELSRLQMINLYNESNKEEDFKLIGISNENINTNKINELNFIDFGKTKEVEIKEVEDKINLIK